MRDGERSEREREKINKKKSKHMNSTVHVFRKMVKVTILLEKKKKQ
jgi:hypothetical protein